MDEVRQSGPRGSILLVEDEPFVAMVARQILEDEGFEVTVASTAGMALTVMRETGATLAMAVIDLGLPDMRGDELVRHLLDMRADLPIMIASGYDMAEMETLFGARRRVALLAKPYDSATLHRAMRDLGFQVDD